MKFFTKEDGIEQVYVQKQDIKALCQMDIAIPLTMYLKIWEGKNPLQVEEEERYEFVLFKGHEAVDYLRSLDWIIDYQFYSELKEEELEEAVKTEEQEKLDLFMRYTKMRKKEQKKNISLMNEYAKKEYKLNSLYTLQKLTNNENELHLPNQVLEKMRKLPCKM